ncbi:MAG: zinc-ribbon domain-containing protein, partial [Chloroflexota bacterium]
MKCPNCGSQIPEGDLFCGECGARTVPEQTPPPTPTQPPVTIPEARRGLPKGLLIGCGGLVALLVIAGCIFGAVTYFGQETPTPSPTAVVVRPTA